MGSIVRYMVTDSPFGRLLMAATDRGLCAVAFGDTDDDLRGALLRQYPSSMVAVDDHALLQHVGALLERLSGAGSQGLPLDVQGTAFQWRVWNALQAIPRGETRTYTQLALGLGLSAGSARAVAAACAANQVAVAIPCHRAVGSNGDLRGFRWGLHRKRALLAVEQQPACMNAWW